MSYSDRGSDDWEDDGPLPAAPGHYDPNGVLHPLPDWASGEILSGNVDDWEQCIYALRLRALTARDNPPHVRRKDCSPAGSNASSRRRRCSMGRVKKSTKARRTNGAMATNKGKLLHGVPVVLRVNVPPSKTNGKQPAAAAGITFKTVFRAKLSKNVNYEDELCDAELLEAAVRVVRKAYRPGWPRDTDAGMSYAALSSCHA